MNLSSAGAAFVRAEEGFVDHWYLDPVNIPTIGTGFTWASDSFREWWATNRPGQVFAKGAKMSRAEADNALQYVSDREYGAAVGKFLGNAIAQTVFDGMTSPVFNMGVGSLDWKWAAAIKAGDIAKGAALLRTTGTTGKGSGVLPGLLARRREEAELLLTGDYTIGSAALDPMADGMLIRGERGMAVADLQNSLATAGLYAGEIDGRFGYGTEAAVLAFQRANKLTPDGWAGPATLKALKGVVVATDPAPLPPVTTEPPSTALPVDPQTASSRKGIPLWLLGIIAVGVVAGALALFTNII